MKSGPKTLELPTFETLRICEKSMNYWDGGLSFPRQRPDTPLTISQPLKKKRPTGKVINGCSAKIIENRRTRMTMKVEIKDNKLFIEIDLEEPTPSSSGKTLVVASTHGNLVTTAKVNDKPITIGLNAYIKP
jgi:hypothetical protein